MRQQIIKRKCDFCKKGIQPGEGIEATEGGAGGVAFVRLQNRENAMQISDGMDWCNSACLFQFLRAGLYPDADSA